MHQFQAIIFDLGGTLIDYSGQHQSWPELERPGLTAAYKFLYPKGASILTLDRFCQAGFELLPPRWQQATSGQKNLTVRDLLQDIFNHFGINDMTLDDLQDAARAYERAVCSEAEPISYGYETLSGIRSSSYKIGLISNTMFSSQVHMEDLERFQLIDFFDAMVFSADVNKWKPSPAPFNHILQELDVTSNKAVFVGDDPGADVLGARRAGLKVIHFESSNRFPEMEGIVPDATIHDLRELGTAIERLNGQEPKST